MSEHTIYHVSIDIRMMLGWPDRRLEGFGGLSAYAARALLQQQLAAGRTEQVMQICDNVGPDGGCMGHTIIQALDGSVTEIPTPAHPAR